MGGLGGDDIPYAAKGGDDSHGDGQDDSAFDGDDELAGGRGDDQLIGHGGSDRLVGGGGNDMISADDAASLRPGADTVKGSMGDDVISAADCVGDTIDCGPGFDEAWFDKAIDVVAANCEGQHPVSRRRRAIDRWSSS